MPPHLLHLAQALTYRNFMGEIAPGAAQAKLRREIMAQGETSLGLPAPSVVASIHVKLASHTIDDMPPAADDLSLLVDVIAMRQGFTSRADAWRSIGIHPDRGRDLLARNAKAIDWPIWFTTFHAAFL